MKKFILALAAVALSGVAHASITPVLVGSPTEVSKGLYSYTYDATLASDQAIASGSYFTLYDFYGFTSVGAVPANWTASESFIGKTPAKTLPTDSASILNVTFNYNGPVLNFDGQTKERDLGHFTVFATSGKLVYNDFTSLGILNSGPVKGTNVATVGSNAVGVAGSTVPEPTTWATMVMGLGLVGFSLRRRSRESVAA
ncbi:MAG: PEPxxWA-CTERM sorting domain-containing protein [Janthinobacterium lividum]